MENRTSCGQFAGTRLQKPKTASESSESPELEQTQPMAPVKNDKTSRMNPGNGLKLSLGNASAGRVRYTPLDSSKSDEIQQIRFAESFDHPQRRSGLANSKDAE